MTKHRKNSIRKPLWDYRTPGYYFITICAHKHLHLFEEASIKQVVEAIILKLPTYKSCKHINLDRWVVMPNHIHVLIFLDETAEYLHLAPDFEKVMSKSVGAIIATLKGRISTEIRNIEPNLIVWQRGYWDRIVRNTNELNRIREYIRLNPERWAEDHENLDRLLEKMGYHS